MTYSLSIACHPNKKQGQFGRADSGSKIRLLRLARIQSKCWVLLGFNAIWRARCFCLPGQIPAESPRLCTRSIRHDRVPAEVRALVCQSHVKRSNGRGPVLNWKVNQVAEV